YRGSGACGARTRPRAALPAAPRRCRPAAGIAWDRPVGGAASVRDAGLGAAAAEGVGQRLPGVDEGQRHRVDAVALEGGRRAVREHVAEVAAAARADL